MDKTQKLEYQQELDAYMEKHQVYDLIQGLLRSLTQRKPKDPLDFLITQLSKPQIKRVFIVGHPGCDKKKIVQELANEYNCSTISMSKVFEKQVAKKTAIGEKIEVARAALGVVDDETVIELLLKKLKKCEQKGKSVIIAGFPINITQALALQSKGIVPTRVFVLNASFEVSYEKALQKLKDMSIEGDLETMAKDITTAYYM